MRAVALVEPPEREGQQHEADRDVEPEDPLPRDAFHDRPAHERAERDRQTGDAAPGAECEPALLRGDGRREQRQGERHDDRSAGPLQRAGDDERIDRRRERRGRGGDREDPHSDREHPLAAEAVAERRAGEQQHREGERVGVDRPLEALERGAQVSSDDREGHRDDEVVEGDHEQAQGRDDERPEGRVPRRTHAVPPSGASNVGCS